MNGQTSVKTTGLTNYQHIPRPQSPILDRAWRTARASSSQETAGAAAPETNTLHAESVWAWVQERGGGRQERQVTRRVRGGRESTQHVKSKVKIKQTQNSSCKRNQQNKASRSVWMWAVRRKQCSDRSPLSGRCLNKGAQRAASVYPSSSIGQERSSWSTYKHNFPLINFTEKRRKTAAKPRLNSDTEGLLYINPYYKMIFNVTVMWDIHLLLVGPLESTSDCSRGKKPCS